MNRYPRYALIIFVAALTILLPGLAIYIAVAQEATGAGRNHDNGTESQSDSFYGWAYEY